MPEHTIEPVSKVQAQEKVVRVELKQGLNPVNDGFSPGSSPEPELEGSKQAG